MAYQSVRFSKLPLIVTDNVFQEEIIIHKRRFKAIIMCSNLPHNDHSANNVSLRSVGQRSLCSTEQTPDIERKYVHSVYDAIAPHFSSTRFAKWPKVAAFLKSLPNGSLVLDVGCGNGKYLGFNSNCFFVGCDTSAPLINICANRGHEVFVGDAVNLPYRAGLGDAAISIAVLHHLSTEDRRIKAIKELIRVVRKGGSVLITVWSVEQEDKSLVTKWTPLLEKWVGSSSYVRSSPKKKLECIPEGDENLSGPKLELDDVIASGSSSDVNKNQQEYFVPWHLPYHRSEICGTSASFLANGIAIMDDKKSAVVYRRYYHVFSEGELERLVMGIDNAIVVDRFFDKSNWCIVLEKTS